MSHLTVRPSDLDFDDSVFEPMDTGYEVLNSFVSNDDGWLPATLVMITGSPGAGKTTFVCENLNNVAKEPGSNSLFCSFEMTKLDMAALLKRFPQWEHFDIHFPDFESGIFENFKTLLLEGEYDLVAVDSFKELKDLVADQEGWTKTKTERELISLLQTVSENKPHTAFLLIQQVLKSGDFAGSKRLQHMVTASLKMNVENGDSWLVFDKNRRGNAHEKLYYEIYESSIEFNGARLKSDREAKDVVDKNEESKSRTFASLEDLVGDSEEETTAPESDQAATTMADLQEQAPDTPVNSMDDVDPDLFRLAYKFENGALNTIRKTVVDAGFVAPTDNKDGYCTWHKANKKAKELGLK